jgi:hypothetical protein
MFDLKSWLKNTKLRFEVLLGPSLTQTGNSRAEL